MENFNQNDEPQLSGPKVKEKSIYLLHLDKARIVILASVIIGIISTAFLIGMKINNSEPDTSDLFTTNDISDNNSLQGSSGIDDLFVDKDTEADPLAQNTDPLLENNGLDKPVETGIELKDQDIPIKKADSDVLTAKNINVVDAKKPVENKVIAKSTTPKVNTTKSVKAKTVTKVNTVPVSSKTVNDKAITKSSNSINTYSSKSGFAIQVASYDNYQKAQREVNLLKEMDYKCYINESFVNGTNFYRVRVGPYSSKDSAVSTLNELQSNSRYYECYMVKE